MSSNQAGWIRGYMGSFEGHLKNVLRSKPSLYVEYGPFYVVEGVDIFVITDRQGFAWASANTREEGEQAIEEAEMVAAERLMTMHLKEPP